MSAANDGAGPRACSESSSQLTRFSSVPVLLPHRLIGRALRQGDIKCDLVTLSPLESELMTKRTAALAFAVIFGAATLCAAADWPWRHRDHDDNHQAQNNEERSEAWQDGFRDGRFDREHSHKFHPKPNHRDDRQFPSAYDHGYKAGFNGGTHVGWRERHNDNRSRGGYPAQNSAYPNGSVGYPNAGSRNAGGQNNNAAYNAGYQDGHADGQRDKATRHSFRPTEGDNYKNAKHGWTGMGDRQAFKDTYRQGYSSGYQRGYNGR